jgi:hypothetical protein
MSMTRDAYAKQVIRVAEAAFKRNEVVFCPHEGCNEHLSVVRQSVYSTRSLFCPVHGHIFKEQQPEPFSKLDWDAAAHRINDELSESDYEEDAYDH